MIKKGKKKKKKIKAHFDVKICPKQPSDHSENQPFAMFGR